MGELRFNERVISSGQTAVNAGATATLSTALRIAGERLRAAIYVTNNVAGAAWASDTVPTITVGGSQWDFRRTVNANEFSLFITNNDAAQRTYDWATFGVMM